MENTVLKGFYFDGYSAQKHDVRVVFEANSWKIEMLDFEDVPPVLWDISKIHHAEFIANIQTFKYGDFPYQTLELAEPHLVQILDSIYPQNQFFKAEYKWIHQKGYSTLALLLIGIVVFCFTCYKYLLPVLAENAAEVVPRNIELDLGSSMYENIIQHGMIGEGKMKVLKPKTDILNMFTKEIDFNTDYPIKVTLVEDSMVNAFALPGGNVIVYTGLLNQMKTKEQLVALLGHEVAHVSHKHSLKNIFRNLSGYLFLSLLTSDFNAVASVVLENANQINNLSYSRTLEAEADEVSMQTLKANHLDPKGLLELFEILQKSVGDHEGIKILSTHPLTKDRIKFAKENISKNDKIQENEPLEQLWQQLKK